MTQFARFIAMVFGALLSTQCQTRTLNDDQMSETFDFQNFNIAPQHIGIKPGEIVLTLDDGPGARTLELAKWLRDNGVPATFFMVGKNARAATRVVSEISKMNFDDGSRAFIVANHSMNHDLPLPVTDYVGEVRDADNILKPYMDSSRQPFLFRAPYGDFTRGGQRMVDKLNNSSDLKKYIGPIFWNIGGALTTTTSADWNCWAPRNIGVDRCLNGYVNETKEKRGGIMLLHDVHSHTVDMLMGTNKSGKNPNNRSLIKELKAENFKFVAIDANRERLTKYGPVSANLFGEASFTASLIGEKMMEFTVQVPKADRLEVWIDQLGTPLFKEVPYDGVTKIYTREFSVSGRRIITIKGFLNNKLIAQRIFPFEI